jgi:hypothetical protein
MVDIAKQGGVSHQVTISGFRSLSGIPVVDPSPYKWLETLQHGIYGFVTSKLNNNNVWDVRMAYPQNDELDEFVPQEKGIITFEVDDISSVDTGLGDKIVETIVNEFTGTVIQVEHQAYEINFDVGIWTTHKSGGTTARMRAFQYLAAMFVGPSAFNEVKTKIGAEIVSFRGGSFVNDEVNGVVVFRGVDTSLICRVFVRKHLEPELYIASIHQDPTILITEEIIIDPFPLP